ncbi:hypothetical protein CYLTODRAFT_392140 [Cylindrobasidium torrendii FP15055 ss-10]|uniref:Uncharacterized protein n=1 Tax=Cylindrobasidium torrendii FP15055 ss-10 TaxID=1314674 RepID=A0A0D7BJS1_9AGAR|nr:hypothetical protein CYLTODRAFT_392140 [Cylindrobasidium torrendii FP15055 ss-10]
MKFSGVAAFLLSATAASAQYFSEGWQPGQPVPTPAVRAPPQVAQDDAFEASGEPEKTSFKYPLHEEPAEDASAQKDEPFRPSDLLDLVDTTKWLESDVSKNFFNKLGVNISEKLASAQKLPWDSRIPLITDANYEDVIVNEELTEQEEKDRVWALVITAGAGRQDGLSSFADLSFDDAYNRSIIAGDLPHVKWGRIDYFNVTYITTKWNVWSAPYLVIATDRGRTLRFYTVQTLRIRDGLFHQFLLTQGYLETNPWTGSFSPGGSAEWFIEFFAVWMAKIYNVVTKVPKFVLLIASGSAASFLLSFMHRKEATTPKPAATKPQAVPPPAAASASSTAVPTTPASPSKNSKTSKRKGKK